MWGLWKPAVILAALATLGMAGWLYLASWRPATARFPLQGIDLALSPPPAEWGTVRAAGADFAYLTATAGSRRREPSFEANWTALPDAGLRRGAVHLFSLCEPAVDQANAFNTFVPRTEDALPAAVDISYRDDCAARPDRPLLVAEVTRFAHMVETHTGKPVLLRIGRDVESDYQLSAAIARPVWVTGNVLEPRYASRPWRMWRASDLRRIEGLEGPVNWDVVAS